MDVNDLSDSISASTHRPSPSLQPLSNREGEISSAGTIPTGSDPNIHQTLSEHRTAIPFSETQNEPETRLASAPLPVAEPIPITRPLVLVGPGTPIMSRTPKPLTPLPDSVPGSGAMHSPDMGRPLNVTDALSYLDAVKVQFQDKPDVYNRFLDIMKDFKSQVIETPGVIERVSKLFHGNPYLIQGFNTFLPVGYRIDISADPTEPNTITVTTPNGTTTQSTNSAPQILRPGRELPGLGPQGPPSHPLMGQPQPLAPPGGPTRSLTPHTYHLAPTQASFDANYSPGMQSHQTNAAASFLGGLNNRNPGPVERQPQAEFNHAIQYLNKIKARYADDPNTYKQFLDILQTYQKEQRHIENSQVYVQVQMLFKDAPDLLAEFKDFLPDVAVAGGPPSGIVILPNTQGPPGVPPPQWTTPDTTPTMLDKVSKKLPVPAKRKKRPVEKEPTPAPQPPPAKVAPSRSKKPKHHHRLEPGSPSFSPYVGPNSPPPAHALPHVGMQPPQQVPVQHVHVHQPHSSHVVAHATTTSPDKLLFFDRAKRTLENRENYEEFLKLLSLFSKEIIDVKTLIERTRIFLGSGDLMSEFKDLVGWDENQENPESGPPGSIRTGPPEALSALPADDGEGPSYRRLPDSEIRLACSGRDELCRSVLNDEWVSHPTWASEEAGFVAHKKNSFEEALHKSEEERHEYHVHIEALNRTIAILEPLNIRIEGMTNEERALFKLKPDLGGSSKSIYHRIIKKVYGRESGLEIIQALQDCPSVAVPVVLARLKQKGEEWRRAQREWSRTWREIDAKNFYRSLDHQGISFKQNDKKNITAKHFVADIESVKAQQTEAREEDGIPSFIRGSVGFQLEYTFQDTSVLHDSLKMVYSFLDHSQAQYSPQERRGVERFLRAFIPLLCMFPAAEFNAACGPLDGLHDDDVNHELNGHSEVPRSSRRTSGNIPTSGVAPNDLRKKLLRTAQEKSAGKDSKGSSTVGSRADSPSPGQRSPIPSRSEDEVVKTSQAQAEDVWIKENSSILIQDIPQGVDTRPRPFFANTTFYTLLRLLQLLYSRLLMCKQIGLQLTAQKHSTLLANPVATELGLDDPSGPPIVLAQAMEALGDRAVSEGANVVYMYLLDACEKLFDSELDQATFEEHMRWFFGNKGYHVFTLDKLITALVKQVQTILSDNKCQELWSLLQLTQNAEMISNQDIIRYRREAERHVGQDDHLYRIQWARELKLLRVQLIGPGDPSVDGSGSTMDRWREYADTYVMTHPTEWVPETKNISPLYLRRNIRAADEIPACYIGGMIIRIRIGTYKLLYEYGSEDVIWRRRGRTEENMLLERARARHEERKKGRWLQG